ncbi:unnamed protein product [Periconia digitata]|uniref:MARVEL domain-containing protein n=1 Tax=Periconia digitata TaxID=1303443 RepID=A0A9W4XL12_9PLEO|nr:unnamed protein product [Periconia digitata]
MVNFNAETPSNVVRVPRWTLALHAVQFVFAIIILGLSAYGISYVPYNALIFSLVVCLCTLLVTIYLTVSQLFIHKLYQGVVALAFHIWMLIFWIVDLGLVANLASIWASPSCYSSYSFYSGYSSSCYYKRAELETRGLEKRDTTVGAYYGSLAAGAVFAGVQLVTWAVSAVILFIHFNRHRNNTTTTTTTPATTSAPPPQYAPDTSNVANNGAGIPMEKYNYQQPNAAYPPQQQQQQQPGYPPQQQQQFSSPYAQDPVPRQDTVSPVSQFGQAGAPPPQHPNAPELSSPQHTGGGAVYQQHPNATELNSPQQHTGGAAYPHNVSELSTPPAVQHQQQQQRYADLPELSSSK